MGLARRRIACFGLLVFLLGRSLCAQQEPADFNHYYRYNLSVGAEYQSLSPFGDYGVEYSSLYDLSAILRIPLPSLPSLYPLVQGGMIQFVPAQEDESWGHTHWYGTVGLGFANRFSKNFEVGAELAVGASEAVFPLLDPDGSRGSPTLLASAGLRIALDPSYSLSLDLHPNIRYFHSLTPLTRFNGFILSVGVSGHYRFGEDPDAPRAIIRSLRFDEVRVPPLFAAMQSYYTRNPITRVTITNVEKFPITDLKVSFFQAGFMDSPTEAADIPALEPGESRTVDLLASFNQEVFTTEGVTPLTGEVAVEYLSRGKAARQTLPVSYDLHDKTALTWDDDAKVGAFVTAADSALRNYTSFIRQAAKEEVVPGFSEPLQIGMQVYYALKEIGCIYQVDPTSPFTAAQGDPQRVDSISLPRDTLKRQTGDCDDLTVLYCALLETVGVESAFITVPGHIYAAFNSKVPSSGYRGVHPDKAMTLSIDGELWVPVEITMIGTDDFLAAWRKGVEQFTALDGDPDRRGFYRTRTSQEVYRPVGLRETDLGLQYGSQEAIVAAFRSTIERLVDLVLEDYQAAADGSQDKRQYNRLGIMCAQYGRYARAQKAFNTALTLDRNYLSPIVNLGNVFYLQQDYHSALRSFHRVEQYMKEQEKTGFSVYPTVLLNLARCYYELENYDRAAQYFQKVRELDPRLIEGYAYLDRGEGGRAAAAGTDSVRFAEGE
ncbi:MAG: tetratricopeptide repeat protein [Spirochaetales bacterium]|nr:tetratricopeptide repeat protein [Spirochaetales bacterium]